MATNYPTNLNPGDVLTWGNGSCTSTVTIPSNTSWIYYTPPVTYPKIEPMQIAGWFPPQELAPDPATVLEQLARPTIAEEFK